MQCIVLHEQMLKSDFSYSLTETRSLQGKWRRRALDDVIVGRLLRCSFILGIKKYNDEQYISKYNEPILVMGAIQIDDSCLDNHF